MNKRMLTVGALTSATLLWVAILSIASRRADSTTVPQVTGDGGTAQITLVDTSAFESGGRGEVQLRANLRNKTGAPVQGLSIDNIEVLEEGFTCRIDALDGPGTQPINVVLVVDTSGSMSDDNRISAARQAASEAVRQLIPGRDRMGLISFSDKFNVLVPFGQLQSAGQRKAQEVVNGLETPDLLQAIAGLIASGGTRIAEPTLAAVGMFEGKTNGAKLIIVMTDGEDGELSKSVLRIGQEAVKSGCKIFTIGFGKGVTAESARGLEDLANAGNGKYYFAADSSTLAQLYKDQVQEASEEFGIRIASPFPKADGLERRLALTIKSPLDGVMTTESRYRVGSMISTVRADPVVYGDQESVNADAGSGADYSAVLGLGIAGCLGGGYFLSRFLPAGESGSEALFVSLPPATSSGGDTKKTLPPPPGKQGAQNAQISIKPSPPAGKPSSAASLPPIAKKLPPPPPRKK